MYFLYWRNIFDNLSKEQKKKYEEKVKERYDQKMLKLQKQSIRYAKKAISGCALYATDKMPNLKKVKSGVPTQILIK